MGKYAVGIDIGTTSVSGVVIDIENKQCVQSYTVPNGTDISYSDPDIREQNAEEILVKAKGLLDSALKEYPGIYSIGVTGQMHGILYTDGNGNAVSELITWQDKRGDKPIGEATYTGNIVRLTGEKVAAGFGLVTHYYNVQNGLVPKDAISFCSIMDYVTMKLCNRCKPLVHSSVAASFGFFDIKKCLFKTDILKILGISNDILPTVTDEYVVCGTYQRIPVSVAIGDNQASFLGTVRDIETTALVNIGTGSQISMVTSDTEAIGEAEIRPLVKGMNIICGSALCGGASYALLEKFFRNFSVAAGCADFSVYDTINSLAEKAYNEGKTPLNVITQFNGKRSDPDTKGAVIGITTDNFTPEQLVLGFVFGICRELYDYLGDSIKDKSLIVASGNAVQRIGIMRDVISDVFRLPVNLSDGREEASVGAALFASVASGMLSDIHESAEFINYK